MMSKCLIPAEGSEVNIDPMGLGDTRNARTILRQTTNKASFCLQQMTGSGAGAELARAADGLKLGLLTIGLLLDCALNEIDELRRVGAGSDDMHLV